MSWRPWFYALSVVFALTGGVLLMEAVYRSGAGSVPPWATAVLPGSLSPKHAFLSERCEACHTPNRGVQAESCILCHAGDTAVLARQSTVFHGSIQSCSGCHVEHQAGMRPIQMDHDVLAAIGRKASSAASGRTGVSAFVSVFGGTSATSPEETLLCAQCHGNRSPHRDLFGGQCAECHVTTGWKIAGYRHPSPTSADCAQCHQAPPSHYMMHFEMVSKSIARQEHARVEQCQLCHQTDSWNSIRGVGWYKHH